MSTKDKENSTSKLAQKMQKKKKTKGIQSLKSSTFNLKGFDLLPNIKLKKYQIIESDLFIKDIVLEKKKEKTQELQKVLTKSENIISKLRKLKEKAIAANDTISSQDIDWIISKINDQNLYDIDTNDFNTTIRNDNNTSGLAYLMQYSHVENNNLVQKAFQATRKGNTGTVKMSMQRKSTLMAPSSLKVLGKYGMNKKLDSISEFPTLNLSSVPNNLIQNQMALIDSSEFDIFSLNDMEKDKTTFLVANEILSNTDVVKEGVVPNDILEKFIQTVLSGYDRINVLYHNDFHAVDVMQTLFTILTVGRLPEKMKLSGIDVFAMLVGAVCHDLHHTGQNNTYHINARTKYAIRYNDISVLENFHIASSFKILSKDETNILKNFKEEEYRIIRKRIIEGILSTDMANHQKVLANVKAKIGEFQIDKGVNFNKIFKDESKLFDNQQIMLDMFLHCSDISNPAKPQRISTIWTQRVYAEFFKQGDLEKEKGLTVSLLCDRDTTDINKAMIGFINFVTKPSFEILVNLVPECSAYLSNMKQNLIFYENAVNKKEEKNNDDQEDLSSQSSISIESKGENDDDE